MRKVRRSDAVGVAQAVRAVGLALVVLVFAAASVAQEQEGGAPFPTVGKSGGPAALEKGSLLAEQSPLDSLADGSVSDASISEPSLTDQPEAWGVTEVADDAELMSPSGPWTLQTLPSGLIYHSYLAGAKESRIGGSWKHERDYGWIWDITLGGRVGILRYGTTSAESPEGFQIDIEGAGLPRLDLEHGRDVNSADFRFGVPLTYGNRRFQTKLAYYHLSSHMGDELMVRLQSFERINYSRDVFVWGNSYYWTDAIRLYAEAGWAFYADGGSEPWEFQFGVEYAPRKPTGLRPVPFVALNSHLRQEVDYGGNLVVQSGWAWRGVRGQLFRMGMEYYTGKSDQFEFYDQFEDKVGFGMWYDF